MLSSASTTIWKGWWWLRWFLICVIGLNKPPGIRCCTFVDGLRCWSSSLTLSIWCFIQSRMLDMMAIDRPAWRASTGNSRVWRWPCTGRSIQRGILFSSPRSFRRWCTQCVLGGFVLLGAWGGWLCNSWLIVGCGGGEIEKLTVIWVTLGQIDGTQWGPRSRSKVWMGGVIIVIIRWRRMMVMVIANRCHE